MAKYLTHDNMSRPLRVVIDKNENIIHVYLTDFTEDPDDESKDILLHTFTNFKKIFVGSCPVNSGFKGNTILVHENNNKYIFIGDNIHSFEIDADEEIETFVSPIGNSDVPYPYAISNKKIYLIAFKQCVSNSKIDTNVDPYGTENSDLENYNIEIIEKRIIDNEKYQAEIKIYEIINPDTGESCGRYSGQSPKQAASKAFCKVRMEASSAKRSLKQSTIYVRDTTESAGKVIGYEVSLETLPKAKQLFIKNLETGDIKTVSYRFNNKIKRVT